MSYPANHPWDQLIDAASEYMEEQQREMQQKFNIESYERYDYDLNEGRLWFSNGETPVVETRILVTGTISTESNTWRWSWANPHLPPQVTDKVTLVRDYGLEHQFGRLVSEEWPAEEMAGWYMSAIACKLLEAQGVYRSPAEQGFLFLLMFSPTWCQPPGGSS